MTNPDHLTRECALSDMPLGVPAVIIDLPDEPPTLLWHGIRAGAVVWVETDAPFGGPRVVRLGAGRIALDRALTRRIRVRPTGGT